MVGAFSALGVRFALLLAVGGGLGSPPLGCPNRADLALLPAVEGEDSEARATLLRSNAAREHGPSQEGAAATGWLEGKQVRVAYRERDSLRARQILTFLEGLPPLPGLPDSLPAGIEVFIAADPAALDSLTGAVVPEWGAGVAVPALSRMVIPGFGRRRARGWDEARVLKHEWAHLGLHQYLAGLRVPRWFDEGYAEWASGGWNPAEGWRLRVSLALGRAPPLDSLALEWPRDRASADLAYLLSATAVEYLARASGERALALFLERWRESGSFTDALGRTYGLTPGQLEEDWRKYVRRRYGWVFVLSHSAVFWLVAALSLLILVRIRRKRDRQAMARLRAGEPPDEPAFWEEGEGGRGEEGPG